MTLSTKQALSGPCSPPKRIKTEEPSYCEPSRSEVTSVCQKILKESRCLKIQCLLLKRVYELIEHKIPKRLLELIPDQNAITPDPADTMVQIALKLKSLDFIRILLNPARPPQDFPDLVFHEMRQRPPQDVHDLAFMGQILPPERIRDFLKADGFRTLINDRQTPAEMTSIILELKNNGLYLDFLMFSIEQGDQFLFNVLIQNNQALLEPFQGGKSALHIACEQNKFSIIPFLLLSGVNPFQTDDEGYTPFCAYNPHQRKNLKEVLLQAISTIAWTLPEENYRDTEEYRRNINQFFCDILMGIPRPDQLVRADEYGYISYLADILMQIAPGASRTDLFDQLYDVLPLFHDQLPRYAQFAKDELARHHQKKAAQVGFHTHDISFLIQRTFDEFFSYAHLLPDSEEYQELKSWFCTPIGKPLKTRGPRKEYLKSIFNPDGSFKRGAAIDLLQQMGIIRHINEKYRRTLRKQPL